MTATIEEEGTPLTRLARSGGCAAKVGPTDLSAIVRNLKIPVPPEVLVGISTSDDAGIYRLAPGINIVLTADFITPPCDDAFLYGRIAAANSISDVYAMGGEPKAALNLCCFPTNGASPTQLSEILRGGLDAITEAGAALIGGHTVRDEELKYGLSVTGVVSDANIQTNAGARVGDRLILTKPVGIGVVVSAMKSGIIPQSEGLPVLKRMGQLNKTAAEVTHSVGGVHGVTDITGFGLGGHSWEMASGSKVGVRYYYSRIPRWPVGERLIADGLSTGVTRSNAAALEGKIRFDAKLPEWQRSLFYDPQTSGGLLISVAPDKADLMLTRLVDAGIEDAAICGEIFETKEPHLDVRP
jgi:selenide,water dikinase